MGILKIIIAATVISISDGDTLTILQEDQQSVKIRMAEIDAPEKKQPFGEQSKQSLADICFGKQAEVVPQVKDRYGRTVARVYCNGVDANAEQVRRGMAWVYSRYAKDKSLFAIEEEVRFERRGLWIDPSPTPPWEWRYRIKHP